MRFGLPQILVLVASVVAVIGVRRLSQPSTDAGITTRQALLVWLLLLTGGLSVWLLAAAGRTYEENPTFEQRFGMMI